MMYHCELQGLGVMNESLWNAGCPKPPSQTIAKKEIETANIHIDKMSVQLHCLAHTFQLSLLSYSAYVSVQ